MWNVKGKVIPATIGANLTMSDSFRQYFRYMPGNHNMQLLQRTAISGTANTIRKVIM